MDAKLQHNPICSNDTVAWEQRLQEPRKSMAILNRVAAAAEELNFNLP